MLMLDVNRGVVNNVNSSKLDMLIKSEKFAENILVFLMKKPTFTAPVTKLDER